MSGRATRSYMSLLDVADAGGLEVVHLRADVVDTAQAGARGEDFVGCYFGGHGFVLVRSRARLRRYEACKEGCALREVDVWL